MSKIKKKKDDICLMRVYNLHYRNALLLIQKKKRKKKRKKEEKSQ